ncbi:CobW family GTP-binding protein [Cohnella cholangitidis]|uniref:GTP-binding protein n=1 Tax=Cohnella cholangitidis TaxID=2598458 RepID=A0A7G5C5Z5_9BACL|nr:GTP-binding protein [Cohnella cholangitidis]QMV44629.1 GTP-binding protein [Cohnella cholangitidis]
MINKIVPVYVLTGFLGSGKTTLLNRLLEDAKDRGWKPAILLNEVGDVNVEGQLIEKDIPMAELLGGCICCTSRGDLGLELVQLVQDNDPDVIWIESTGIAQPLEIMEGVTEASLYAKLELKNVVTVVDSRHLLDKLRIGSGKTFKLMKEQIRAGNIIVLNKSDLVQADDLTELQSALKDWNPNALIVTATRSEIDPSLIYERLVSIESTTAEHVHDHNCSHGSCEHGHHDHETLHDHVNAVTYYFKGSVDSVQFESFLQKLPDDIYRAKGIVSFSDAASLFLFQYAYRESDFIRITPQKPVNNVAVFIGEGFSRSELISQLELLDNQA